MCLQAPSEALTILCKDSVVSERVETKEGANLWSDSTHVLTDFPDFLNGSTIHRIPSKLTSMSSNIVIKSSKDSFIYITKDLNHRGHYSKLFDELKFKKLEYFDRKAGVAFGEKDRFEDLWCKKLQEPENSYRTVDLPSIEPGHTIKMAIFTKPCNTNLLEIENGEINS